MRYGKGHNDHGLTGQVISYDGHAAVQNAATFIFRGRDKSKDVTNKAFLAETLSAKILDAKLQAECQSDAYPYSPRVQNPKKANSKLRKVEVSSVMMNPDRYATQEDMRIMQKYRDRQMKLPPKEGPEVELNCTKHALEKTHYQGALSMCFDLEPSFRAPVLRHNNSKLKKNLELLESLYLKEDSIGEQLTESSLLLSKKQSPLAGH